MKFFFLNQREEKISYLKQNNCNLFSNNIEFGIVQTLVPNVITCYVIYVMQHYVNMLSNLIYEKITIDNDKKINVLTVKLLIFCRHYKFLTILMDGLHIGN